MGIDLIPFLMLWIIFVVKHTLSESMRDATYSS